MATVVVMATVGAMEIGTTTITNGRIGATDTGLKSGVTSLGKAGEVHVLA
jgi:hypothetical protein